MLLRLRRCTLLRRLDLQVLVLQEAERHDVASDGEPATATHDGRRSDAIARHRANATRPQVTLVDAGAHASVIASGSRLFDFTI